MEEIVLIQSGKIRGLHKISKLGDNYVSFQGVPFAKPPVGNLRFKAPIPADSWDDILDAVEEKPIPFPKIASYDYPKFSEDCLYLNVYAKNLTQHKKPVIVYFYGGSFHSGSSSTRQCGPDYFMQRDVILITANYRLNILGFLSFKDATLNVPGNAALKDQRLVLKWVKENIEQFGGDSNNVTLVGHSAAAGCVHMHLLSSASKDLFNRAIIMSGSAFCFVWSICKSENMGEKVARKLGWNAVDGERGAYEFLLKIDAEELTRVAVLDVYLTKEEKMNDFAHNFGPKIEPYENEDSFLTQNPLELVENCWSKNIDVIFWNVSNESLFSFSSIIQSIEARGFDKSILIPYEARQFLNETELKDATEKFSALYRHFEDIGYHNLKPVLDYFNDHWFLHGIHRGILSRVRHSEGNTFHACFDLFSKTLSQVKIRSSAEGQSGAAHGDEIFYLFAHAQAEVPSKNSRDYQSIQKMLDLFVGFAREGSNYCVEKLSWLPISNEKIPYSYKSLVIQEPEWEVRELKEEISRRQVWDEIFNKAERKSVKL